MAKPVEQDRQNRLQFLFRNLNSGKTADEVYQELDSKTKVTQPSKKADHPKPKPVRPAKSLDNHPIENLFFNQQAPLVESVKKEMFYFCDPIGRRLMAFRAPSEDSEYSNSRRELLLHLLSNEVSQWTVTTRGQWKAFRQSGYQQANNRTVIAELIQSKHEIL